MSKLEARVTPETKAAFSALAEKHGLSASELLRKLSDKTQSAHIRALRGFAGYLHRRPDTASAEDLRRYQLHMVETGVSPMSRRAFAEEKWSSNHALWPSQA